jgi:Type I phosphodiesterase / nucleotide pyrophosphatase
MTRKLRWKTASVSSLAALGLLASAALPAQIAGAAAQAQAKHVLLISVDGLHASDLAQCEANNQCPNLAMLAGFGTTYTNANASKPSDSAPGLMALVTGGSPKLTGVYYDDSYDRTMYRPPAQSPGLTQDCSGPAGAETALFENVDYQAPTYYNPVGNRPVIGGSVDPAQLPYAIQNGKCGPVTPNNFLRTNSIFSVAHAAGMYTAWADKHPVYNAEVAGNGTPNTVSDPFNTEINADSWPSSLVDTRGTTVNFPLPNPDGTTGYAITDSVGDTEAYDQIKVDAILNQIDGWNSWGTQKAPVPAIFGMNFQTVSVGQKLVDPLQSCVRNPNPGCNPNYMPGGYEPGTLKFTPQLTGAIGSVDAALGAMVSELQKQGQLASTTIIITAKHGQSPIDPSKLNKIGHAETTVLTNAGITPAMVIDDDIALVWLTNNSQAPAAVAALQADKHGANTARIQYILSGVPLAMQFNSPTQDPRTPDLIVQPIPGTIYSSSKAKVAEHGGFALNDTHVAMIVVNGKNIVNNTTIGASITQPVRTYQVAPTILADLGLNPSRLDSVRFEHVQVLPGS